MSDSYSEITSQSWFSRIGGAFKGIVVGFILIAVSLVLLFWNEGRAVKRHKTLQEGGGAVVSISPDRVEPGMNGRLVHLSGLADTPETLTDGTFGVSRMALKLRRNVEMYQWRETSSSETNKKLGGGTETVTTYNYERVWDDKVISSSDFKKPDGHRNPSSMPVSSLELRAAAISVGAFTLSPSLVGMIDRFVPLDLPPGEPPSGFNGKLTVSGGGYYLGQDPLSPQIGDLRITFEAVDPLAVSLVSRQIGTTFEPYLASTGGEIELLEEGTVSAESMFQGAEESNRILTWVLRLAGAFLMFVGFSAVLKPLSVLADVVPLLGSIVGAGTGFIAFLMAGVFSLATIGIAWIVYRPLLGIALLAGAGAVVFLIRGRMKKGETAAPAHQPPPPPLRPGG